MFTYGFSSNYSGPRHANTLKCLASNLLIEALSKLSRDSYQHVYHVYRQFILEQFPSSPIIFATLDNLTMFIDNCFQKNLAASTVLTALSYLHNLRGCVDLTRHFIIQKTLFKLALHKRQSLANNTFNFKRTNIFLTTYMHFSVPMVYVKSYVYFSMSCIFAHWRNNRTTTTTRKLFVNEQY